MREKEAIDHVLARMGKELSPSLHYHCLEHTLEVMKSCREIGLSENITSDEMTLLMTAAAYHDCGFMFTYKNHEERGCIYAAKVLPDFDYNPGQIEMIEYLIMCTKIPQRSDSHLGNILCDADLDYLGQDEYDKISSALRQEMHENGITLSDERWMDVQIDFLETQYYFTDFSKEKRQKGKDDVLARLKEEQKRRFGGVKSS